MKSAFFFVLLGLAVTSPSLAADSNPDPMKDLTAVMPKHGTVSTAPASGWETSLAAGNGTMGALLAGGVGHDEIIVDDAKLWLPKGTLEKLPSTAPDLTELRRIIHAQGYEQGQKYFLRKAAGAGWSGHLAWTDAFHPGFTLTIDQTAGVSRATDYARVEDFSTGEVWSQWKTDEGDFSHRLFVSRPDNTIVAIIRGPSGKVSFKLGVDKIGSDLIQPGTTFADGWILFHNVYVKGKGGYDAVVRVTTQGGTQDTAGQAISVSGADAATLYIRVLPWRTPLPESQAWVTDPSNPDFADGHHPARRDTVQAAGKEYDPRWMDELKADVGTLGPYDDLLKTHAAAWGGLYDRVSVDLGGSSRERAMSSEALLHEAQQHQTLPPALLERMYDAGRYVFMCCAGPQTPPNLFGIWTDTWSPAWSGDYTTDTNVQLDCECAYSANLAECMNGYFYLWDGFLPDFRRNAKSLYGCGGILAGTKHSNNGLALHFGDEWPGNQWIPGAPWLAHWYYDRYAYTLDRDFLRQEAVPFMRECARFYEDFLRGTEDAGGCYTFCPSFSAENGSGDNASQDIEICRELLTNLIAGCETLGIESDGVARWKVMLAKLPPLLVNAQGQLKEWSNPEKGEHNDHRHLMHLYGAFESGQFSEEENPKLFAAARVALINRIIDSHEDATHGHMHMALAAAGLGLGDYGYARLSLLARHRSIYPSLVDAHFGGPNILCDDGNGATPEIIDRMIVQSKIGRLSLLPALPAALPHGALCGVRARGGIGVDRIAWDIPGGQLSAVLTSRVDQTVALVLPPDMASDHLTVAGVETAPVTQGVKKMGCALKMAAGQPVAIRATFHPLSPEPLP